MDDARWLRDIEEIKMLKARYGMIVDTCPTRGMAAANEVAELFTEDCVVDFTEMFGIVFNGHAGVRELFGERLHKGRGWMWHSFTNPIIEVEGDTAKGYWVLYAMSTSKETPMEEPRLSYGYYNDVYVRTPKGWRQQKLKVFNGTRNWVTLDQEATARAKAG